MHYEIHVTVEATDIEKFKADCEEIKVKPIVIEFQHSGEAIHQVMTSSKHSGDSYVMTLLNISVNLTAKGYVILRKKVEILPSPTKHPNFLYYETHFRLKLPKDYNTVELQLLANKWDFHFSKNIFKSDDEFNYQMMTFRRHHCEYDEFMEVIEVMKAELDEMEVIYDKVEVEECVYDSNLSLDDKWLN